MILATCAALFIGDARAYAAEQQTVPSEAAQFVRQALEAEAAGDATGRSHYLAKALAADPDYAPAHWQLGEVRQNGVWIEPVELAHDDAYVNKIAEYRKLRDAASNVLDDHLRLAKFAKDAGLAEQSRWHFENAHRLSPDLPDVQNELGMDVYRDQLISRQQKLALEGETKLAALQATVWVPGIGKLCKDARKGLPESRKVAIEQLGSIHDPSAIPTLEAATKLCGPEVSRAVVKSLSAMRTHAATQSLVRHAVLAQDGATRQAAIEALRSRYIYAYMPMLLSYMQLPIQSRWDTYFLDDGRPAHRLSLFQEGSTQSLSFVSEGAVSEVFSYDPRFSQAATFDGVVDSSLNTDMRLAQTVKQFNSHLREVNQRATDALRGTTQQSLTATPKAWWEWWANYNELYGPSEKPISYLTRSSGKSPQEYQVRYHGCFVAGTMVATSSGPIPIEEIKVGEIVLAQDVATGELGLKPVLATTIGPELPLVEITSGGETIRCTYGHLFWVSGVGWKMAKELESGQWLHTTHGPVLIENVEKRGKASCHNLIVAEFNTYFVTDQAFLVHDINVRGPTMAIVPGLVDEAGDLVSTSP